MINRTKLLSCITAELGLSPIFVKSVEIAKPVESERLLDMTELALIDLEVTIYSCFKTLALLLI